MRLTGIWILATIVGTGCAVAADRRAEEGCPPGLPCERVQVRDVDGVVSSGPRPLEPRLDALPLVGVARQHPKIGRLRGQGSLSIGGATTGFVVACRTLPAEGPHHVILAEHSHRGTACATDDLVEALLNAAAAVNQAKPGARLTVGNLGRAGGGDIPWSVSHRSGRDADLGLYLQGPDGKPFLPKTLVPLDRAGKGDADGVPVRFDTARNWLLVKTLLTDPSVSIQWMFLSRSLKRMVLDQARKSREPAALIRRAEEALAQPARSRPHNDHLHLRIGCPPDDVLEGCRDTGSQRSWFRDPSSRIEERVAELLPLARSQDAVVRADAATVLGRLGTPEARREVLRRLDDDDAGVRWAAALSLLDGGVGGIEVDLVHRLARQSDETSSALLLAALDRHVERGRRAALLAWLLSIDRSWVVDLGVFQVRRTVRDWAVDAVERLPTLTAVQVLMDALADGSLPPRRAATALQDLTGADPDAGAPDPAAVGSAWLGWWRSHKDRSPREWWVEAFRRRGLQALDPAAARSRALHEPGSGPDTHRWWLRAWEGALGVRYAPWDIDSHVVLMRRAISGDLPADVGIPEPDPATSGPGGGDEAPESPARGDPVRPAADRRPRSPRKWRRILVRGRFDGPCPRDILPRGSKT
jgi:penicillin-insensitive murein endopeptidase